MDLNLYDWIVLNTSGGKDSQAMLSWVSRLARFQRFPIDRIRVYHADLGRAEWKGTAELAETQAKHFGLTFEKISRPQGDLLDQVKARRMWPSSQQRYCTSDQKRDQIGKLIRALPGYQEVAPQILNCMGIRAQESPARAKKQPFSVNKRLTNSNRAVLDWYPIFDWTVEEVWEEIKRSGAPHHPAYDLGMPRLSCVLCIFSPKAALVLAGKHNPELLNTYVELEAEIGHEFRLGCSMASVKAAIMTDENVGEVTDWRM